MDFSVVILSSGLSERMGEHKALLQWSESSTFLEKIIHEYLNAGCKEVICTVNPFLFERCTTMFKNPQVKFVLNQHPERGRMFSIKLGLSEVKAGCFCFIQNVDNPFITDKIIREIASSADPDAWVSPEYQGQSGHPVLLPTTIVAEILKENDGNVTLQEILKRFHKIPLNVTEDAVLRNINTREDLKSIGNRE